jgi:hypothetical protein
MQNNTEKLSWVPIYTKFEAGEGVKSLTVMPAMAMISP